LKGFPLAEFLLRKDVGSMKKELIAAKLTLTDNEATELWQVYEQYSAELSEVNDRKTAILKKVRRTRHFDRRSSPRPHSSLA
jgi:hypothetical protein